ncbi:shikimate dehydrogenase family protein [Jiella sonneratiae]|uniref:Shikimate dehydrogenase n=1 Tax=Jiella sonneratiae TaxID=2816856 RepID=A0ABS3J890_9HYPH|nr:shikimate dehydrogenase [Jiella sonneratiae]MBO0905880.1 shikimate dehydrogenase [Jiella sonneratiae]
MTISGKTRIFAIVGDPIVQARTPALLNPMLAAAGIDAVLLPFHVPAASFAMMMPALKAMANLDGLVVTYPFKERALAHVDVASDRARMLGVVNAMRRRADGGWEGDMFDGIGLLAPVEARRPVAGAKVLLIGAGGAGRAIAVAFAAAGAASIAVSDLDAAREASLAALIEANFPTCGARRGCDGVGSYDIVVNATTLGMKPGDPPPIALTELQPSTLVADVVPSDRPTAFLTAASEKGAATVAGHEMTKGQAKVLMQFLTANLPAASER